MLVGLYQAVTHLYREEEKELRSQIRATVTKTFPEQAARYSESIGLFYHGQEEGGPDRIDNGASAIVLIHGLDDPGKVWMNLTPALVAEGYAVWQLEYPNDQPPAESAQFFFDELKELRSSGVEQITVVAHSMGGLISREMLTSEVINYSAALDRRLVPEVTRLIMVGTPNHGSQMARFRFFAEVRDHLDRLYKGQTNGLGFVLDGAGEAKIDLLPGSRFLTELNSRPHPQGIDMLVIAGITAPWSEADVAAWLGDINKKTSRDLTPELEKLGRAMTSMSNGLGDGLVTLDSARLEGIPLVTVPGTHLSMIRNISADSDRVPPAVPLILDRLNEEE